MGTCRIEDYSDKWFDSLYLYIKKTFPLYTDSYIDYCLVKSKERLPSLIVLNDKDEIVGCHMYLCTKAIVNGEIIDTQWGYNTYLDPEYRSTIGLDLILLMNSRRGFGLGLTEINNKIQKKLKKVFFKGVKIKLNC